MMHFRTLTTFPAPLASNRQLGSLTIVFVECLVAIIAGCDRGDNLDSFGSGDKGRLEKRDGASSLEMTPGAVVLEHDFGLLRVGIEKTAEHRFPIHNDSSVKWTFRRIVNTCACMVAKVSAPAIVPGKTEHVTVVYETGKSSRDDSKNLAVLFAEPEAPKVILRVRCSVREQVTIAPTRIAFARLGKGEMETRTFEIRNYSAADWEAIFLHSSEPWVTSTFSLVEPVVGSNSGKEVDTESPRQLWRVTVGVDAKQLSPRRYEGSILVEVVGADMPSKSIPILAEVVSPVNAIPQQLFFGSVKRGVPTDCSITLRFSPGSIPQNAESVRVEHDLADQLKFRWAETAGENWQLVATLTPAECPDSGNTVKITFPGATLPQIDLPVYVMVRE